MLFFDLSLLFWRVFQAPDFRGEFLVHLAHTGSIPTKVQKVPQELAALVLYRHAHL